MECLPQIHTIAIHAEEGFRAVVPGIGIFCREDNSVAGVGVYSNSIGKRSNYAIVGNQPWNLKGIRIGGILGIVDGYQLNNGGMVPMAAAAISWGDINFTVIPPVQNNNPLTVQISFNVRFK